MSSWPGSASAGRVEDRRRGDTVFGEGEPATCFFVLLAGTMSMHRRVENTDVEVSRTDQVGVYAGATQAFMPGQNPVYLNRATAVTDCRFWVIAADEFGAKIRAWFPMATHMLEGLTIGMRSSQAAVGQRERLLSLGRLSAGLTHELNNPGRGGGPGDGGVARAGQPDARQARPPGVGKVDAEALRVLVEVQDAALERMAKVEELSPMEVADAEDAIGDWLDDHDVANSWDLAPALVAAGVDPDWLDEVSATVAPELMSDGIHWLAYALETEQLMREIEDSTVRISTLVGAAKTYSQVDRAALQDINVKEGIVSTLIMLGHKIKSGPTIDAGEGLRQGPAAGASPSGRAEPGLDEPDRQRAAGHAGRRYAHHPYRAGRTTACWSRSATAGPGSRRS